MKIFENHEEDFRGVNVSTGVIESRGIVVTQGIRPTNPVDIVIDDTLVEFKACERDFVGTWRDALGPSYQMGL